MPETILPIFYCLLVDFPEDNDSDCEYFPANGTYNTDNCFRCHTPGRFLFGGLLADNSSPGLIVCIVLWAFTILVGIFGILGNALVISVVRRRNKPTSFDFLLYVLATVDLVNSVSSSLTVTASMFFYEDWDRGLVTLIIFHGSVLLFFFGRSISSYLTVLITLERYLVISNPMRSTGWFTPTRIKVMTGVVVFLAALLNFPRWSSLKIAYHHGQNVPSLAGREYIILPTVLEQFWYKSLKSIHYIDTLAPFPILLLFNILLFVKISQFVRSHQKLTKKQKVDIRAARMFVPVVIMLFFCNIEPITFYLLLRFHRVCYRELASLLFLSVAVNSAVNLPIYYARGGSFRKEVGKSLPAWLKPWMDKLGREEQHDDNHKSTEMETTERSEDEKGQRRLDGSSDGEIFG